MTRKKRRHPRALAAPDRRAPRTPDSPKPFDSIPAAAISLLVGMATLYALFPPLNLSWLVWIAWVPLLYAVTRLSGRRLAIMAFVMAYALNVARMQWLHHVTYAGWFAAALYLSLYLWVFALFAGWCWRRGARLGLLGLLPAAWALLELAQANLFTGFGWFLTAYSQFDQPLLIQTADLGGPYLFGFAAMIVNVALFLVLMHGVGRGWGVPMPVALKRNGVALPPPVVKRSAAMAAAVATVLVVGALGAYGRVRIGRVHSSLTEGPSFTMVQGNVPFTLETLFHRTDDERMDDFMGYIALAREAAVAAPNSVLCLPESSVPVFEVEYAPGAPSIPLAEVMAARYRHELERLARDTGQYVLFCALRYYVSDSNGDGYYSIGNQYNTIYLMDPSGRLVERYDKIHRVPFGEYIPLHRTLPWLSVFTPFDRPGDGILAGTEQRLLPLPLTAEGAAAPAGGENGTLPLGPLVCFEDTHPYLTRGLRRMGARVLVNLTNNAWFGESEALTQELAAAVFRSVESRLPMVRVTNNGVSALIDPLGRYRALKIGGRRRGARGTMTGPVALDGAGATAMPLYTRWGDWVAVSLIVAGFMAGLPSVAPRRHP